MKKDIIVTAKTVEEAALEGATTLGVSREDVTLDVIEEPKKGFLGIGSTPAKVKVTYILKPLEAAKNFIETLLRDLGIAGEILIHDDGNGESLITIEGEGVSALIGHHGDTLEAFQYLVNLAANKKDDEDRQYTRITINIENYREKREETLRKLAAKMAAKVKKTGRNVALEPMNAYERRIIHAEIQKIEGVSTNSVGYIILYGSPVPLCGRAFHMYSSLPLFSCNNSQLVKAYASFSATFSGSLQLLQLSSLKRMSAALPAL